jgi:aminoglycoside 3-N-acetyltransferase
MARDVTGAELTSQLHALGVERGSVLLVHAAFSRVRPLEGGPEGLIDALLSAIGPDGTLAMPSMSDVDDEPFAVNATPCRTMGIVADTFWRRPGVLRSDSPHAFAAIGRHATAITRPHPIEVPHGPESPVSWLHALDARVLLLGVGHDANTTIHLAENMAGVRYRRSCFSTVLRDGQLVRIQYAEVDHCCENFALMDHWLEAEGSQRRGLVGYATARLARSQDIVRLALTRLERSETVCTLWSTTVIAALF